jgi:predicted ester cyclase
MASAGQIVGRIMEAFNAQDLETYLAYQSAEVEFVLPGGIVLRGRDEVGQYVRAQWAAFPDGTVTLEKQIASEDEVATEILLTGTHTGPLRTPNGPIEPTGKRVSVRSQSFHRIDDEKAASRVSQLVPAVVFEEDTEAS